MNPKTNKLKNINKYSSRIAELMQEKKAKDIQIFDVSDITTLTDAFIICTSDSQPQSRAIYNHIEDEMFKEGIKAWSREGLEKLDWVLIDFVDFVVHIFSKESRDFYDFERLWGDARITKIKDE